MNWSGTTSLQKQHSGSIQQTPPNRRQYKNLVSLLSREQQKVAQTGSFLPGGDIGGPPSPAKASFQ